MATGKSLGEFRERHDPTFRRQVGKPFSRELPADAKVFLVTAAQNGTPVDKGWWAVLQQIAKHRGAELLVIPIRYKNPTSQWTASAENAEWWCDEVRPFLWSARHGLHRKLTLLADIKIQPTASDPLTGAEALSLEQSGVIGHTKLQLRSIPTPASRMAKILTTTGACTVENYTDSRAGAIGEFHHSLSAVLVEIADDRFHLRHVHYDRKTRSATDLCTRYTPKGACRSPRPLALVMGDTHVRAICPLVQAATFGKGGMIDTLKPEHLIWHDVLDAYSCSPHHAGDPFAAVAKRKYGGDDVEREVNLAIDFILEHTPKGATSVVVGSNHNDMLGRWVKRTDWRTDPQNANFYLRVASAMERETVLSQKGAEYPDPFALLVKARGQRNVRVLDWDESFSLGGVELGMHGNLGPNGARGSITNLRRIGSKSFIGHSHSPGINEGAYQVGTSSLLRLDYNKGPSSWLNCHGILHADGKRQLVVIVDGAWRA